MCIIFVRNSSFVHGYTGNPYFLVQKVAKKLGLRPTIGGLQGPKIPKGLRAFLFTGGLAPRPPIFRIELINTGPKGLTTVKTT